MAVTGSAEWLQAVETWLVRGGGTVAQPVLASASVSVGVDGLRESLIVVRRHFICMSVTLPPFLGKVLIPGWLAFVDLP